jgi:toxin ParE1/3/4
LNELKRESRSAPMPIRDYEFSSGALFDLEEIRLYTQVRWGLEQTLDYLESIYETVERLQRFPNAGKDRTDIGPGLRSVAVRAHIIYYRVLPDLIRITNILHAREDTRPALHESTDEK